MSLSKRMEEYVRACFSGIWITSHEHVDAIDEISQLCQREGWRMASWNIAAGLRCGGQTVEQDVSDPLAAVGIASLLSDGDETTVVVLENFHRFLQSAEIIEFKGRSYRMKQRGQEDPPKDSKKKPSEDADD